MFKSLNCCVLLLCVFATGCGGGLGTVPAGGSVTVDGKPAEGVLVLFTPDSPEGMPASGVTDATGTFKLTTEINGDGALPGAYKVAISKYEETGPDVPEGEEGQTAEEMDMDAIYAAVEKGGDIKSKRVVAAKYGSAATSGLTATIEDKEEEGANSFTFEVTKK